MKGGNYMIDDTLSHEEIIQLLTDRILDGDTDINIKSDGFLDSDIEEAHLNCLALYF
jgi:hypothetical protein